MLGSVVGLAGLASVCTPCDRMIWQLIKGRHGSGIKGNFESGENKSKVCSYIFKGRECNPLFVTIDTSCKLFFFKGTILCSYVSETA